MIYTLAPLFGGFLAGIFEEFHNISITKITNSANAEHEKTIAIQQDARSQIFTVAGL